MKRFEISTGELLERLALKTLEAEFLQNEVVRLESEIETLNLSISTRRAANGLANSTTGGTTNRTEKAPEVPNVEP